MLLNFQRIKIRPQILFFNLLLLLPLLLLIVWAMLQTVHLEAMVQLSAALEDLAAVAQHAPLVSFHAATQIPISATAAKTLINI
jgi:uncharacterized membrane protein YqjE